MINAPVKKKAKKSKKQRKVGRNANYCAFYKLSHRREHNKVKRLKKHLVKCPGDKCAEAAIERCNALIRGY